MTVPIMEPAPGLPLYYDVLFWAFHLVIAMASGWRRGVSGSLAQEVKRQLDTALERVRTGMMTTTLQRVQDEIESMVDALECAVRVQEAETTLDYALRLANRVRRRADTESQEAALDHISQACVDLVFAIQAWEEEALEGERPPTLDRMYESFVSVQTFLIENA